MSARKTQKLMMAFGNAIDDVELTWSEITNAGINILLIGVLSHLKERSIPPEAVMGAFSKQLRELVALTMA